MRGVGEEEWDEIPGEQMTLRWAHWEKMHFIPLLILQI